ncbi:glycosyltransferase family 4 protein [Massilia glaciei]|uniref:Glycosyl transferase n=1 Tax=Massilia glaciei TaxID=1524097 RepID=A0A2U2HN20_9BURK|nr:glycosyltransferase [Massilia glaciei]PWF48900.1 glycosyl transferase [Massilia glaciei]
MKIQHIIIALHTGGAELMLKRLIESHRGSGYEHSVISITGIGTIGHQLRECGIDVHAVGMSGTRGIPRALLHLVRLLRERKPDVVQTWMYHADLIGGLAARIAGNRNIIWGIRTTDVHAGGKRTTTLVRQMCARLSRWVPHMIVCAAQASRRSHAAIGYDDARMVVIPNGFDFTRMAASAEQRAGLRQACGFGAQHVVVGTLGRFNLAKDQQNFVRAAGLLASSHPQLRFLMVGRDVDAANAELANWIARTGHGERFVLLGERTDVPVCLSAMDIFCLSSRTEGFPNVVGEAMSMCLPCVVTDVGDARMLVADTGVVVPKEDSEALAGGVGQMLAMAPEARAQLGRLGRMRVNEEFSIERARERFEALYQRTIIENKGSL